MAEEQKKDKKKVLTAALAAGLAIALAVGGGTYAYLADSTDPVVNEINMNKSLVDITESENKYDVVPGTSDDKDPYLVADNTVDSYLYVKVDDETGDLVDWDLADGWTKLDGVDGVYYQKIPANKDGEKTKYQIIKGDKIYYPATVTNNDTTNKDGSLKDAVKLSFTGYIMQEAGFEDDVLAAYYAAKTGSSSVTTAKSAEDFATALANADDDAVIIANGVTVSDAVTLSKGVTLVGGNYTNGVTVAAENAAIENATIDAPNNGQSAVYTKPGASVTLDNVTLTRSKENSGTNSWYVLQNEGTTTLNDCTATSKSTKTSLVENGYYNASDNTAGNTPTLTINGGTYTGGINVVKNDYYGVVEINGGTFSEPTKSYCAVLYNYNKMTVNDGTFTATGKWRYAAYNDATYNTSDNAAVGELTINGGTFKHNSGYGINNRSNKGTVDVNGGSYSSKVSTLFLSDDLTQKKNTTTKLYDVVAK